MPAPSQPVAGGVSQGTGANLNVTVVSGLTADDIIVVWYTCMHPTDPATLLTWPPGFTEGEQVPIHDELGTVIGRSGWAWKRSDGTESGTVIAVGRNGSGGATASGLGNTFRISGCETSGNPYNVSEVNNPDPTTSTAAFPPITTTVPDTLIVTMLLKNGAPGNYGTPTGWTVVSSNSGTGGADSGADVDARAVASTGTYAPADETVSGYDSDTGWATFQIAFIEPQGGGGTPQELTPAGASVSSGAATVQTPQLLTASGTSLSGGAGDIITPVLLTAIGVSLTAGLVSLTVGKLLRASGVSLSGGLAQLSVGAAGVVRRLRLLLGVGR